MSVYSRTNNEFVALVETSGILQNMTSSNIEYVVCGDGETPTANTGIRLNPSKKLKFAVLDGMTAYVRVVGNTTGDVIVSQNDSSKLFIYKGSKPNFSDLPLTRNRIGDTWNIINKDDDNGIRAGDNVCWNGTEWDILAGVVDLSGYVEKNMIFRKDKTAYTVGSTTTAIGIPTGYFLECTTVGTTGASAPVIQGTPSVGDTITDGTVVWTIRKSASTQDLTNYLPLSGGNLTGGGIGIKGSGINSLNLEANKLGADTSAGLNMFSANAGSGQSGVFELWARNIFGGNNRWILRGEPSGALRWINAHSNTNNDLGSSAIVAKSLGQNGYIRYADGRIRQWKRIIVENVPAHSGATQEITYDISFFPIDYPYIAQVTVVNSSIELSDETYAYLDSVNNRTRCVLHVHNGASVAQDITVSLLFEGA